MVGRLELGDDDIMVMERVVREAAARTGGEMRRTWRRVSEQGNDAGWQGARRRGRGGDSTIGSSGRKKQRRAVGRKENPGAK